MTIRDYYNKSLQSVKDFGYGMMSDPNQDLTNNDMRSFGQTVANAPTPLMVGGMAMKGASKIPSLLKEGKYAGESLMAAKSAFGDGTKLWNGPKLTPLARGESYVVSVIDNLGNKIGEYLYNTHSAANKALDKIPTPPNGQVWPQRVNTKLYNEYQNANKLDAMRRMVK